MRILRVQFGPFRGVPAGGWKRRAAPIPAWRRTCVRRRKRWPYGCTSERSLGDGGRVIGVIPQALADKELAHPGLTQLHVVSSMHERKALMADLSDAFLCLPGGYGTWEEFFEVLTWSQLGFQRKACGLLNVNGYYDPLLAMADKAMEEGFVRADNRQLLLSDVHPERLLDNLSKYFGPNIDNNLSPDVR